METVAQCSRGWRVRCSEAKSPRCRCACQGKNHGNPAARKDAGAMATKLTSSRVFERPWDNKKGDFIPTNYFLPGADEVADIHLARAPGIEGQAGGAMADIRHRYVYHSPDGFEWGYGGSGPAELALNILGLFVPAPEAWRLHQPYKRAVIAGLAQAGPHTITAASVRDWIMAHWRRDA